MVCKHFGVCGGCTLPGVPYAEQLARKQKDLAKLLQLDVPPLIPSPAEAGFRSKVAFVFRPGHGPRGKGLIMGHYAPGSQKVVPIDECPVHHGRGNRIAFALRDRLVRAQVSAAGPALQGILRHVIIRTTEDGREASAMLVVTRNDKSLRTPVRGLLASAEKPDGFFINIHSKPGPYMVGPETIKIEGRSHVKEVVDGVSYLVSPTAFFQTNVGAAAILVKLVKGVMLDDEPSAFAPGATADKKGSSLQVLDLYCGSGLFALQLAKAGAKVTGIEENREAIRDAESNARLNRLPEGQVRFMSARVEDAVARVARDPWDAVVMDPPRQGCPPEVLAAVFERMRPRRVAYVSCNPEALAMEMPVILKAGYRVDRVQAVDMFPHTNHIETVIAFARG